MLVDLTIESGENYSETLRWNLFQHMNGTSYPPEPENYNVYGIALYAYTVTEPIPVTVYCWNPADVNHDLEVNLYDAVLLLVAYGSKLEDENCNRYCDIAEPYGKIDLYDAVLLLSNYGEKFG